MLWDDGSRKAYGVDDETREVVGIPKEKVFSEIDAITADISDSCKSIVIPDFYLQTIDEKTIIVEEISSGKRLITLNLLGIKAVLTFAYLVHPDRRAGI